MVFFTNRSIYLKMALDHFHWCGNTHSNSDPTFWMSLWHLFQMSAGKKQISNRCVMEWYTEDKAEWMEELLGEQWTCKANSTPKWLWWLRDRICTNLGEWPSQIARRSKRGAKARKEFNESICMIDMTSRDIGHYRAEMKSWDARRESGICRSVSSKEGIRFWLSHLFNGA